MAYDDLPISTKQVKLVLDTGSMIMLRKLISFAKQLEEGSSLKKRSRLLILDLYALSSLLYYVYSCSIFSDGTYDRLCRYIFKHLREFQSHNILAKGVINRNAFKAGSGYHITKTMVPFIDVLANFYREIENG